jgi:hypothetical protein
MPSRGVEEMRREIMLNRSTAYLSHVSEKNRCLAPNHDAVLCTTLPYSQVSIWKAESVIYSPLLLYNSINTEICCLSAEKDLHAERG